MDTIIKEHLVRIKLGKMQAYQHVAVVPLFSGNGSGPEYLTMKEALDSHFITITELTEDGKWMLQ